MLTSLALVHLMLTNQISEFIFDVSLRYLITVAALSMSMSMTESFDNIGLDMHLHSYTRSLSYTHMQAHKRLNVAYSSIAILNLVLFRFKIPAGESARVAWWW